MKKIRRSYTTEIKQKRIFGMESGCSLETHITSVRRQPGSKPDNGPLTLRVEGIEGYGNWTQIPSTQIDDLVAVYAKEGVVNTDGLVGKRVIAYYSAIQLTAVQPILSSD